VSLGHAVSVVALKHTLHAEEGACADSQTHPGANSQSR
jgi:hypothetical protein